LEVTREEIEDLATWAEGISNDAPSEMGFQIEASDLKRFAAALRHLLQAQTWRPIEGYKEGMRDVLITGGTFWNVEETYPLEHDCDFVVTARPLWGGEWVRENDDDQAWRHKPTRFMHLPQPPSSFEERASATPSDQQNEGEA
jgi:hypothetical protein